MTQDDAINTARGVAASEGWPWIEPVRARLRRRWLVGAPYWEVFSNAGSRGMNVRIVIDDRTSAVLEKGFLPR
jgi:hypothetical protein